MSWVLLQRVRVTELPQLPNRDYPDGGFVLLNDEHFWLSDGLDWHRVDRPVTPEEVGYWMLLELEQPWWEERRD